MMHDYAQDTAHVIAHRFAVRGPKVYPAWPIHPGGMQPLGAGQGSGQAALSRGKPSGHYFCVAFDLDGAIEREVHLENYPP
jgi:hypothetical protein